MARKIATVICKDQAELKAATIYWVAQRDYELMKTYKAKNWAKHFYSKDGQFTQCSHSVEGDSIVVIFGKK